jgi:hypothetical protein
MTGKEADQAGQENYAFFHFTPYYPLLLHIMPLRCMSPVFFFAIYGFFYANYGE